MVEIPAIGPKLIFDALAPEVVVDQQKSLDTVNLIEQQRYFCLMKRPLLLAPVRPVLFGFHCGDPCFFVEPLYLYLDALKGVSGEGWDLAGFRILKRD